MDYKIRAIRESEYPLLDEFLYEAIFVPEGAQAPARTIIHEPELQVYVADFGKQKDDICLVAETDEKIVGAVWVRVMNDYGHIEDGVPSFAISLYKEYRGYGIGSELMKEMLCELKKRGYEKTSLSVQKANYAVEMYKKAGFEIIDETEEEYIMVCDLKGWNMNKSHYKQILIQHRHWLHQHPELAMQEKQTTEYIVKHLKRIGLPYIQVEETGVFADLIIDSAFPMTAVRAEIDAVPVQEETGLSFASQYKNVMHACGHDANTAILLTLAEVLAENKEKLNRNIRFIFEPAEEIGEGAKYMISHGALENPKPQEFVMFHFGNQESRAMEIQQSISTAKIGGLCIRAYGKASHFFQYQEGLDAMYAMSKLVIAVNEINESLRTEHPFVLRFGMMQAGASGNIVADYAEVNGSIRAFTSEDYQKVYDEMCRRVAEIEQESGVRFEIEVTKVIPPIINDKKMVQRGSKAGREVFGSDFQLGTTPFLVGDNAAYYMEEIPGMRVVFLAKKEGEIVHPMHNAKFDIDESVMVDGLQFLITFLESEMEE